MSKEPTHVRFRYSRNGKQVLQDGEHYADGCDEAAAGVICAALNSMDVLAKTKLRK